VLNPLLLLRTARLSEVKSQMQQERECQAWDAYDSQEWAASTPSLGAFEDDSPYLDSSKLGPISPMHMPQLGVVPRISLNRQPLLVQAGDRQMIPQFLRSSGTSHPMTPGAPHHRLSVTPEVTPRGEKIQRGQRGVRVCSDKDVQLMQLPNVPQKAEEGHSKRLTISALEADGMQEDNKYEPDASNVEEPKDALLSEAHQQRGLEVPPKYVTDPIFSPVQAVPLGNPLGYSDKQLGTTNSEAVKANPVPTPNRDLLYAWGATPEDTNASQSTSLPKWQPPAPVFYGCLSPVGEKWRLEGEKFVPRMAEFRRRKLSTYSSFDPELGRVTQGVPKAGSHAFVKCPNEDGIRLNVVTHQFGEACGHQILANEEPVLFAGEVLIGEDGLVLQWNNMSGTYRPPVRCVVQAGLPMQLFSFYCGNTERVKGIEAVASEKPAIAMTHKPRFVHVQCAEDTEHHKSSCHNNLRRAHKMLQTSEVGDHALSFDSAVECLLPNTTKSASR